MSSRYKKYIEFIGHGFWEWNSTTDAIYFSPQWKQMLGYSNKEITQNIDEWISRIHPNDLSHSFNELASLLRGTVSSYRNEHRMLCKDGTYRWVLSQAKVVQYNDKGHPLKVVGTFTDIEDVKNKTY